MAKSKILGNSYAQLSMCRSTKIDSRRTANKLKNHSRPGIMKNMLEYMNRYKTARSYNQQSRLGTTSQSWNKRKNCTSEHWIPNSVIFVWWKEIFWRVVEKIARWHHRSADFWYSQQRLAVHIIYGRFHVKKNSVPGKVVFSIRIIE